jgi:holo-ACP synthase CitX
MPITLEELLASRDARRQREMQYLADYPDLTLLVLTIVVPGSEKRTAAAAVVAEAAMQALHQEFDTSIRHELIKDLNTGYEAFLLLDMGREEAKSRAIAIEDTHPLGRLMDIDIIGVDGIPLGRGVMNRSPRRCIICDNDARICMRAKSHTPAQIDAKISSLVNEYLQRN